MKKIIIALDYDPSAQKIAEAGYSLAKSMNAEITILHVVSEITYYSSLEYSPITGYTGIGVPDSTNIMDVKAVVEASKDFLNKTKQYLGDESIKIKVEEGDTADAILKTAKEINADIIILGSHSRRGLEKILMGSVAEKVLNRTSVPLFIIPTKK